MTWWRKKKAPDPEPHCVDLNSGMLRALNSPPPGYVSRREFVPTDVEGRIRGIPWLSRCGKEASWNLSVPVRRVASWREAVRTSDGDQWENVELEAQNQLTVWLTLHAPDDYRRWNDLVEEHKAQVVLPLVSETLTPLVRRLGVDEVVLYSIRWDILGALMANSYMYTGHRAYFFLELLLVYEMGCFPCGWSGKWPSGELLVY